MKTPKRRITTEQISRLLPLEIQQLIWELMDEWAKKLSEVDEQHRFELSVSNQTQVIIHRQEIPFYEPRIMKFLRTASPKIDTVIVLDNGYDEQKMMFMDE